MIDDNVMVCDKCEYKIIGIHICEQAKAYDNQRLIRWAKQEVRKFDRKQQKLEIECNQIQKENLELLKELDSLEDYKAKLLYQQRLIRLALNEYEQQKKNAQQ